MIYPLLVAVLGLWALFALYDRPLKEYVRIFFACTVLTLLADATLFRIFRIYEWHMWLLADERMDLAATSAFLGVLDPLLGVLFARYCRRHPVLKALGAAALLGALEWWMVAHGYLIYHRFWHPLLTVGMLVAYFLLVRQMATGALRIPPWVDTFGMAAISGLDSEIFLGVLAGLWEYQANWSGEPWLDGRTVGFLLHGLLYAPLVTIAAAAPLRHRWAWAAGATIALVVAEGAAWSYGLLVYHGWGVGLSLIRWAAVVSVTVLYAAWL